MGFSNRFEVDVQGEQVEFLIFMEEGENNIMINQMVGYQDVQLLSSVKMGKIHRDTKGFDRESTLGKTVHDVITDMEDRTAMVYAGRLIKAYLNGEI